MSFSCSCMYSPHEPHAARLARPSGVNAMHAALSRFFSSTISFHELTAAVFARPSGDIRAQAAARRFRSSTISNHVLIAAEGTVGGGEVEVEVAVAVAGRHLRSWRAPPETFSPSRPRFVSSPPPSLPTS